MNTHDIFISYSRHDLKVVQPIKEELEQLGFSCWMDLEGIESGSEEFTQYIAAAIGGSAAVLFFLSKASQESRWSLNELRLGRKRKKHVVIVYINDDEKTDAFELMFGGTDDIDWRKPEQKEKLLRNLRKWTGKEGKACEAVIPGQSAKATIPVPSVETKKCAKCHRWRLLTEMFECEGCGKTYCVEHQNRTNYLCPDCTAATARKAASAEEALKKGVRKEERKTALTMASAKAEAEQKEHTFSLSSSHSTAGEEEAFGKWDVKLEDVPLSRKMDVVNAVMKITGWGREKANDVCVRHGRLGCATSEERARQIARKFQNAGARVNLVGIERQRDAGGSSLRSRVMETREKRQTRKTSNSKGHGEEDGGWNVKLLEAPLSRKMDIVNAVMKITGLDRNAANALCMKRGQIAEDTSEAQARQIAEHLEHAGARIKVVPGAGAGKGAAIGAAIGSIVPGLGTLLGGGIGAVVGGLKNRKGRK